jgi:hypothetical protein
MTSLWFSARRNEFVIKIEYQYLIASEGLVYDAGDLWNVFRSALLIPLNEEAALGGDAIFRCSLPFVLQRLADFRNPEVLQDVVVTIVRLGNFLTSFFRGISARTCYKN